MHRLVASFDELAWQSPRPGVREKKLSIGSTVVRLLELTDRMEHPNWCVKGHTGFVLEGGFTLDIDGNEVVLNKGDVFVVDDNKPDERHIPKVGNGGMVLLLLVERDFSWESVAGDKS